MLLPAKQPPTQYFRLEKMLSAENIQCLARPEASGAAALDFVLSESEGDGKKTGAPTVHAFLNELQEGIDAANMQRDDVNEDAVEGLVRTFLDQFSGGKAILQDFAKGLQGKAIIGKPQPRAPRQARGARQKQQRRRQKEGQGLLRLR